MSKIPEVDIPIYMNRNVSQRINHCHLHRNSWAGLGCAAAALGLAGPVSQRWAG
jgi:hypothetical protein